LKITVLKCIVLPAIAAVFIWIVRMPSDIALFIIMGSALPVGSIIAVIVPPGEVVRKTVAGGILFSNLASVVTVPVFMSIYGVLYGM
jgi:predicted permease